MSVRTIKWHLKMAAHHLETAREFLSKAKVRSGKNGR